MARNNGSHGRTCSTLNTGNSQISGQVGFTQRKKGIDRLLAFNTRLARATVNWLPDRMKLNDFTYRLEHYRCENLCKIYSANSRKR
jgi:hypothetical protein